jgi:hypothetical protein
MERHQARGQFFTSLAGHLLHVGIVDTLVSVDAACAIQVARFRHRGRAEPLLEAGVGETGVVRDETALQSASTSTTALANASGAS